MGNSSIIMSGETLCGDPVIGDLGRNSCATISGQVNPARGDIFIVPNSLQICDDHGTYGYTVDNCKGLQVCFIGWLTNDQCENWADHSYEKFGNIKLSNKFPMELFMGKCEGDTIELSVKGIKMVLTCRQQPYRYGNNGKTKFEEILYDLTKSFGGVCNKNYFDPPLLEGSQCIMIIANHERYARSLEFPSIEPANFRFADVYIKSMK
jgi:hypothetical protein